MNWKKQYFEQRDVLDKPEEYTIDGYRYTLFRHKGEILVMVCIDPVADTEAIQHESISVNGTDFKVEFFELDGFVLMDSGSSTRALAIVVSPGNNFESFNSASLPASFSWCGRNFEVNEISGAVIRENELDFLPSFDGMPGVNVLEFPDHIRLVRSAFNNMPHLESVIISDGVWQIEDAFCDCARLEKVCMGTNLEMVSTPLFSGCNHNLRMLVSDLKRYAEIDVDWKEGCHSGVAPISGLGRTNSSEECFSYGTVDYPALRNMQIRNINDSGFKDLTLDYDTENLNIWPGQTRRLRLTDRVEPSQPLENYRTGLDCPEYYITHDPACLNISNFTNVDTLEISSGVCWLGRDMGQFFKNADSLKKIILNGPMPMRMEDFGAIRNVREILFHPKVREYHLDGDADVKVQTPYLEFYGSENDFRKIWNKFDIIVEEGCFAGNERLEVIHLPEGITRIEESAFAGCSALREVVIPASVKKIGMHAFAGCGALKSVNIANPNCDIADDAFDFEG